MKIPTAVLLLLIAWRTSIDAQTSHWLSIIRKTEVDVQYFSPVKSNSFTIMKETGSSERGRGVIKEFTDQDLRVALAFVDFGSHIEMTGEALNLHDEELCFTLKIVFPSTELHALKWSYDLDSTVTISAETGVIGNFVDASTLIPPAGAFNTDERHNGGYGDKVGAGRMSFYPVTSIATPDVGLGWGIDMGIPLVYRLAYDPMHGMITEFDLAVTKETRKFPNRAYFKLLLFESDQAWNMRSALQKYYQIQPEYFTNRLTKQGIWLPFAPLLEIKGWKDFGFAFHETTFHSRDRGVTPPVSAIQAGHLADVLTFQYTEPWEEELEIRRSDSSYEQVTDTQHITKDHAEYSRNSAALDKDDKLIARRLETPWKSSGWSVSINQNTDPEIEGFNRYDYVRKTEIDPALAMNVNGIYFDCLEWHWQYDLNYRRDHFPYADFPLTFSSSLGSPRPAIWSYSSDYEFIAKIADEMHRQGKYVMGNTFYWIPFSAGKLDLFGSELSWYLHVDTKLTRLKYLRAMAGRKPAVFLLNEGLDDAAFSKAPYDGYRKYFERMVLYGFLPSFFSVNAVDNIYWSDSLKYNQGRPFFKKYIPLIKEISEAGWRPVTHAKVRSKELNIERFGGERDGNIYLTVYNATPKDIRDTITIDSNAVAGATVAWIEELISGRRLDFKEKGNSKEVVVDIGANSALLIKVTKVRDSM